MDLQEHEGFGKLGVELVSLSPDHPSSWRHVAAEYGLHSSLLTDVDNKVADLYGVMRWRVPPSASVESAEPGHTFVLVDGTGTIRWIRDYGAPENGGLMYVPPEQLVSALREELAGEPGEA